MQEIFCAGAFCSIFALLVGFGSVPLCLGLFAVSLDERLESRWCGVQNLVLPGATSSFLLLVVRCFVTSY